MRFDSERLKAAAVDRLHTEDAIRLQAEQDKIALANQAKAEVVAWFKEQMPAIQASIEGGLRNMAKVVSLDSCSTDPGLDHWTACLINEALDAKCVECTLGKVKIDLDKLVVSLK